MYSRRGVLAIMLALLFLGLSFNAYACLLPVGVPASAMGSGCSSPENQPVRQVCDAFKTISVQSASESFPAVDCHAICSQDTASFSASVIPISRAGLLTDHPTESPPQDLLLKISVLRI